MIVEDILTKARTLDSSSWADDLAYGHGQTVMV